MGEEKKSNNGVRETGLEDIEINSESHYPEDDGAPGSSDNRPPTVRRADVIIIAGNILIMIVLASLIFLFGFGIKEIFSPILVFSLIAIILIAFWRYFWAKILLFMVVGLFFIWVLINAAVTLIPFITSAVLAYVLDPLVRKVASFKYMNQLGAVLIVTIPIISILILAISLTVAGVYREAENFVERFGGQTTALKESIEKRLDSSTNYTASEDSGKKSSASSGAFDPRKAVQNWTANLNDFFLINFNLDVRYFTDALYGWILRILSESETFLNSLVTGASGIGKSLSFGFKGIGFVWGILWNLLLTPILTIYLLFDFRNIRQNLSLLIPKRYEGEAHRFVSSAEKIVNSYLRGMIILTIVFTVLFYVLLSLARVKYALLLALIRGLFNLVPFVGVFAAFIIALIIGSVTADVWWVGFLKILIIFGAGQLVDTGFLAPKILGDRVRLHPFIVVLSIFLCGYFFNFIGILIAVPFAGVINLAIRKMMANYLVSPFYTKTKEKSEVVFDEE